MTTAAAIETDYVGSVYACGSGDPEIFSANDFEST
jgi:hypothetical protein